MLEQEPQQHRRLQRITNVFNSQGLGTDAQRWGGLGRRMLEPDLRAALMMPLTLNPVNGTLPGDGVKSRCQD